MSRIIHSGLVPESMNDSTSLSRLTNFFRLASDRVSLRSMRSWVRSSSRSIADSMIFSASAPIPAVNMSSPKLSWACMKSSSESSRFSSSGVMPGSMTTKFSK